MDKYTVVKGNLSCTTVRVYVQNNNGPVGSEILRTWSAALPACFFCIDALVSVSQNIGPRRDR